MYLLKHSSDPREDDIRHILGQNIDMLYLFVTDATEHGALLFFKESMIEISLGI